MVYAVGSKHTHVMCNVIVHLCKLVLLENCSVISHVWLAQ